MDMKKVSIDHFEDFELQIKQKINDGFEEIAEVVTKCLSSMMKSTITIAANVNDGVVHDLRQLRKGFSTNRKNPGASYDVLISKVRTPTTYKEEHHDTLLNVDKFDREHEDPILLNIGGHMIEKPKSIFSTVFNKSRNSHDFSQEKLDTLKNDLFDNNNAPDDFSYFEKINPESDVIPNNAKHYACNECKYATPSRSHLTEHVKSVHKGIKDYQCTQCSYASSRKSSLKRHLKCMHSTEKDLFCRLCPYTASIKDNLAKHMKSTHINHDAL